MLVPRIIISSGVSIMALPAAAHPPAPLSPAAPQSVASRISALADANTESMEESWFSNACTPQLAFVIGAEDGPRR